MLPAVDTKRDNTTGPAEVEEYAFSQEELDIRFKDVVVRALAPPRHEKEVESPSMDDSNKKFRTYLLGLWLLSNAILTAVILNLNNYRPHDKIKDEMDERKENQQIYFKVILWSTFGLAFFRFVGCVLYWIKRNTVRWFRRS